MPIAGRLSFSFAPRRYGRAANAELSGPEGPLARLVFRMTMRNCDALTRASRTSRSNGNGLRSQTSRSCAPAIPLNSALGNVDPETSMRNGANPIDKALHAQWGHLNFLRGRVLCVRVENDKVVLVEPNGGYFYPTPDEVEPTERPDERTLVSAVTGSTYEDLEALRNFCAVPRTMQEIEGEFPGVAAWRLRKLGILKGVGRRSRHIVSQWAGWSLAALLEHIFSLGDVPTRNDNTPVGQR